jgi:hypothetical protein
VTAWLLLEIWCPEAHAASTHSIAALPAYARLLALNEPLLPLPEGKSIHVAGTEVRSLSDVLLPFPLYLLLAVQVTGLIRFIKKIRAPFVTPNKFIKKLDLKIFPMILIMYYKY